MRTELLAAAKKLYREKLVAGTSGNISLYNRKKEEMWITPSSVEYETMKLEDIVCMKLDGTVTNGQRKPSSEWKMHGKIYLEREDVNGIVHTHSPYATAFAVCAEEIPTILIEMVPYLGGSVPVAKFGMPGSEELGVEALRVMNNRKCCLLSNHGTLAIGKDLASAFETAQYLEDAAMIYHHGKSVGNVKILSDEIINKMLGE